MYQKASARSAQPSPGRGDLEGCSGKDNYISTWSWGWPRPGAVLDPRGPREARAQNRTACLCLSPGTSSTPDPSWAAEQSRSDRSSLSWPAGLPVSASGLCTPRPSAPGSQIPAFPSQDRDLFPRPGPSPCFPSSLALGSLRNNCRGLSTSQQLQETSGAARGSSSCPAAPLGRSEEARGAAGEGREGRA